LHNPKRNRDEMEKFLNIARNRNKSRILHLNLLDILAILPNVRCEIPKWTKLKLFLWKSRNFTIRIGTIFNIVSSCSHTRRLENTNVKL